MFIDLLIGTQQGYFNLYVFSDWLGVLTKGAFMVLQSICIHWLTEQFSHGYFNLCAFTTWLHSTHPDTINVHVFTDWLEWYYSEYFSGTLLMGRTHSTTQVFETMCIQWMTEQYSTGYFTCVCWLTEWYSPEYFNICVYSGWLSGTHSGTLIYSEWYSPGYLIYMFMDWLRGTHPGT